jgi:hypothetical protein
MRSETTTTAEQPGEAATHDVHVKRVPHDAWCHGRHNALQSGLTFREYLIHLLRRSTPVDTEKHLPAATGPADGTAAGPAPPEQTRPDRDDPRAGAGPSPHGQRTAPAPRPGRVQPPPPVGPTGPSTGTEPPVTPTPAATPRPGDEK